MLTQKRHEQILKILEDKGAVSVADLTVLLNASESTVRRDLIALSKMGKLNKVHGGATLTSGDFIKKEDNIDEKLGKNVAEKTAIAKYAAMQIQDNDYVYLDAGTTTLLMIDFIQAAQATFVTNGIGHARALVKKGFKTYILGGELKSSTEAIIGLAAAQNLHNYNFSKCFIGTNGVAKKQGFTTPDTDEAYLKAAAIEQSFAAYVLADATKFDRVSTVTFARLEEAAIITDVLADKSYGECTVVKEVM